MGEHVLWAGTARTKTVRERLVAAAAGEFSRLSLFPTDVTGFLADGGTHTELTELAASYGVSLSILDPFGQWLPVDKSALGDYEGGSWFDVSQTEFFELGRCVGIDSLTAVEGFSDGVDVTTAATHFGQLCDSAATEGWMVHLEFLPFSRIPDLETAWQIVERADRDNGGLVFDTWHYCQGTSDDELLRQIPGEKIFQVQVSDGVPAERNLRHEALHNRRFPGDGGFDLTHVLGILDDIGGLGSVGVEVMSDETRHMSPAELGKRASNSLRSTLEAV